MPELDNKGSCVARIFAGLGALVAAAWLSNYLLPAAQDMMLDQALSFLLGILVTGLLGWTAHQPTEDRRFWTLLTAGWVAALLGNIAWGIYEMLTGKSLPFISWVDGFYLVRYGLIGMALGRSLVPLTRRQGIGLMAVCLAAAAMLWFGLFLPAPTRPQDTLLYFLAGAIYPILDAALIYVALLVWAGRTEGRLRQAIGVLTLALIAYGGANLINFGLQMGALEGLSSLTALSWLLSDLLTGIAALQMY